VNGGRRHLGLAPLLVVCLVAGPAVAASAQTLTEYLERGSGARFTGSQAVRCDTPDGRRDVIVDVAQGDGVFSTVSSTGMDGTVTVAGGALAVDRPDGSGSSTAVPVSETPVGGRYSIDHSETARLLGRPVTRVTVTDGSATERAVLAFDEGTGVLLSSRVLNDDGSVYCETTMVSFEEEAPQHRPVPDPEQRLESIDDHHRLPEEVAGFRRLDAYRWHDGGVIGFYSDGLFSFSLLATTRPVELAAEEVTRVESDGGSYTRWFGAGQVMTVWDVERGGLAVSGDLPVDLLEDVTAELPAPQSAGLLSRMWRNLFG
jgi:hypothetical protein